MTDLTAADRLRRLRRQLSPKRVYRRARHLMMPANENFLRQAKGIIHVGANVGQERDTYSDFKLPVVWIEPIPDIFETLKRNVVGYKNQRAFRYLVADDRSVKTLNIANHRGASSSILDLKLHREQYPDVTYVDKIEMETVTLPDVIERENIDLSAYDTLILDTQGSELMILRGAAELLPKFRFVQVEAPDYEAYAGCPLASDIIAFMAQHGFTAPPVEPSEPGKGPGRYYDLLFTRG